MKQFILPSVVLIATAIGYWQTSKPAASKPVPVPGVAVVVDRWGFDAWAAASLSDDPRRALLVGYAAQQVADLIETDPKIGNRLQDTKQVETLWRDTLDYATRATGAVPQAFADQFAKTANSAIGLTPNGEGAELDDAGRRNAVEFFRALAQSLR